MRVPILLPIGRDAQLVAGVVEQLQLIGILCTDLEELAAYLDEKSGPFIVGDEALQDEDAIKRLIAAVVNQPEWSDLPGIVLTGQNSHTFLPKELVGRREILVIRRPVRKSIFTNMIESAVEIRRRQFQIRDLIEDMTSTNERLRERTAQLRKITLEMTRVEDRERKRIAQLLHDDLQQMLASARLQTEILFDHLDEGGLKQAKTVYDIISQAMQQSRHLSHELNPVVSSKDSIDHSLEHMARRMAANYKFTIRTQIMRVEENISDDIKRFVYRSVQELLFNCIKHAQAGHATLELAAQAQELTITISDDGIGFDPQRLKVFGGNEQGFGLFSILERASILEGTLEIHSQPGEGSCFKLRIPLSDH